MSNKTKSVARRIKNSHEKPDPKRRYPQAGISHDPKDAPRFSHRTYEIYSPLIKERIICIEDDERKHYPFLKQWLGMEIDIENQFSINNGTLGLDLSLHLNGKHRMEYMVRLKTVTAKKILDSRGALGICNEDKKILLIVQLLKVDQLADMYHFKTETDKYIKKKHLYPKAWTFE